MSNVSSNGSSSGTEHFVLHLEYKITVSVICGISLIINSFAIYILKQTFRIPPLNKFLASALFVFHVVSNASMILEKSTSSVNVYISTICLALHTVCTTANAPTVALMSLERLWALSSMRLYFKYHKSNVIKLIPILVWTMVLVSIVNRFILCPIYTMTTQYCENLFRNAFPTLVAVWTGISLICYIKIFKIMWRTSQLHGCQRPSRMLDGMGAGSCATLVVFAFLLTSIVYLTLVLVVGWFQKGPYVEKITILMNLVEICNSFVDPFLYVLWFKECRFVLMKKLSFFFPGMERKVEVMRIEVYDIVTALRLGTRAVWTMAQNTTRNCKWMHNLIVLSNTL